ncbi:restriction endonuclease subunit S [Serratia ureilytica]|uniref:restriction endonuclease subunit S n=1 Tax=Serratia ureilytica TaxID=300181 RepID=UPI0018D9549A|nr:restriction endonuclease subunit S [Serratia ureilytica]MBH2925719.1 restriction endonuclease subunit S [Serratia ureilytica]
MVPKEWGFKSLDELALVERGKFSVRPRNDPRYFGGMIPFVQTGDISSAGTYLTKFKQTLNAEGVKVSKVFPQETILITIAANIGDTAITTFDVACPDSVVAIQPYKEKVDVFWLKSVLETKKNELDSQSTQNAQKNINLQVLKPLLIRTPPLPEQKIIAQILSTWDKAITITEQLLSNSQQQKKGLMQQLLTGKNRFQEYDNEWSNYFLSQLFDFKKGKGLSKGTLTSNGRKCVLYGELYTRYSEVITDVVSRTAENDGFTSRIGDILIPASTTTTGIDLSNATAILEDQVLLGGDINVLRPKKKINSVFMAYLLTHIKKKDIASRAQGITIIHLYGSDLKTIKVFIPDSITEQEKIVTVLLTFDNEIEVLKQKLINLKQEKKALMQQLLTGKRRVKVGAA